jgi:hypothetical protein
MLLEAESALSRDEPGGVPGEMLRCRFRLPNNKE